MELTMDATQKRAKAVSDTCRKLWHAGIEGAGIRTKGDLMETCFGEGYTGVDSTLPQGFVDHMQNDHNIDVRQFGCVDYRGERNGDYVNLAELLVQQIREHKFILVKVPEE